MSNKEYNNIKVCRRLEAKEFIDANIWDGEDRSGCNNDVTHFTPDELQELIDELLEHLFP